MVVMTKEVLLAMNQSLLDSIASCDYDVYSKLCAEDMSCMEPESNQNVVIGKGFHKYYFDIYGTADNTKLKPKPKPHRTNVTMVRPHVQWIGTGAAAAEEPPIGAVISYVKLTQHWSSAEGGGGGGAPVTVQQSETRVWEKRGGGWVNIHFHKSPPA